jgi:3-hydroxybutyryl-CoA dehydrogenase
VQVTAAAGLPVVAVDSSQAAVDKGMASIRASAESLHGKAVAKGKMSKEAADAKTAALMALITPTTDRSALADVDLGACAWR